MGRNFGQAYARTGNFCQIAPAFLDTRAPNWWPRVPKARQNTVHRFCIMSRVPRSVQLGGVQVVNDIVYCRSPVESLKVVEPLFLLDLPWPVGLGNESGAVFFNSVFVKVQCCGAVNGWPGSWTCCNLSCKIYRLYIPKTWSYIDWYSLFSTRNYTLTNDCLPAVSSNFVSVISEMQLALTKRSSLLKEITGFLRLWTPFSSL